LLGRLVERAGHRISTPIAELTHLFPAPAALAAADLRGLGLTGGRIDALKGLANAIVEGTLDFGASADDIVRQLTRIRGVGTWTAQYVALRALGEPDAFPSADLVLRRVAANCDKALSPSALEQRSEAWRPWRAYAAIHLWAAALDKPMANNIVATHRRRLRPSGIALLRG
jgi:AraC family transcriptional regulator, regulatory protein of adaptative response / DNA-3-methyladenine glycosylase II